MKNVEICDKKRTEYTSRKAWDKACNSRTRCPGSSGAFYVNAGYLDNFDEKYAELKSLGYKDLNLSNGGDDDWLVIDHDSKTFTFFEDGHPNPEQIAKANNLRELWENF